MKTIKKYPRTPHILDSRLQPGDEDLAAAGFAEISGRHLIVEEKIDGANAAISFDENGALRLQSRGHYLTGGPRERHFSLFKSWAHTIAGQLWPVLGARYIAYGEWTYAKHTIFYDALPHYFQEFDVYDHKTESFLSTARRRALLTGLPISSVPVLHEGVIKSASALTKLVAPSAYKSPDWRQHLMEAANQPPHKADLIMRQTDQSELMEGLYIKVEEDGIVQARYKYIRHSFLTTVIDSASHWLSRPILSNQLAIQQTDDVVAP